MPRRSKLTPDLTHTIAEALAAGVYAREAIAEAGVGESTYYRWLERGSIEQERQDVANAELDDTHDELDRIGTKPGNRQLRTRRTTLLKQRNILTTQAKPHPTEEPYREFREACARASARAQNRAVEVLRQVGEGWSEPCTVCGGTGTVTEKHAGREGKAGADNPDRTTTKAVVRVCGTCDGRGQIVRDPDWRAIAWYLERRHPDQWRRRDSHEHVGPPVEGSETPGPIQIVGGVGSPEVTQAAHEFLRVAREQRGGPPVDPAD